MTGQIRKGDSVAVQVAKVAQRVTATKSLAATPGAAYRTSGRDSGATDGAGTDLRGRPGVLALIYLAAQGVWKTFGARNAELSAGLVVHTMDDAETVVLQAHACADPIAMSRMR